MTQKAFTPDRSIHPTFNYNDRVLQELTLVFDRYVSARIHGLTAWPLRASSAEFVGEEFHRDHQQATAWLDHVGEDPGPVHHLSADMLTLTTFRTRKEVRDHLARIAKEWHDGYNALARHVHWLAKRHEKIFDTSLPDSDRLAAQVEFLRDTHWTVVHVEARFAALMDRYRTETRTLAQEIDHQQHRLVQRAQERMEEILGDGGRILTAGERTAADLVETERRKGMIRIARAVTTTAAIAAYTTAAAAIGSITAAGGAPLVRVVGAASTIRGGSTLPAASGGTYPLTAAQVEAYLPGTEPRTYSTDPVHIEEVVAPAGVSVVQVAHTSEAVHRIRLDWDALPTAPATVRIVARGPRGLVRLSFILPVPTAPAEEE